MTDPRITAGQDLIQAQQDAANQRWADGAKAAAVGIGTAAAINAYQSRKQAAYEASLPQEAVWEQDPSGQWHLAGYRTVYPQGAQPAGGEPSPFAGLISIAKVVAFLIAAYAFVYFLVVVTGHSSP